MDPIEFVELGKKIYEDGDYNLESRCRTAINRIYYGMIHFLKAVKKISYIVDFERFHKEVIEKIKLVDNVMGTFLFNMKRFREDADYRLNIKIEKYHVNNVLKLHDRMIKRVNDEN